VSAICEGGSGTTRLYISETAVKPLGQTEKVSEYITADRPETTAAFPASEKVVVESNPNYTTGPNPIPHTITIVSLGCSGFVVNTTTSASD